MTTTPHINAPYMTDGQALPEATHNSALNSFDAFSCISILDRDLSTPPGSPAFGDCYLVKATGTGAWSGHDNQFAAWYNGWIFAPRQAGRVFYIVDEAILVLYNGSTTTVVGAAVSSGQLLQLFRPQQNEPPASNPATPDTFNAHPCLDFDTTTQEIAVFSGIMPRSYGGGNIVVYLHWAATSATSGTGGWDVTFERLEDTVALGSDHWATAQTVTAATVPGAAGTKKISNVVCAAGAAGTASLTAGDHFRIRIRRDVANDTAAGDLELYAVELKEA